MHRSWLLASYNEISASVNIQGVLYHCETYANNVVKDKENVFYSHFKVRPSVID